MGEAPTLDAMVTRSYMSRREAEQQRFHVLATVLIPVVAILLQVMLPRLWARLAILDLPLIVTLFFAVSRRSPIAGTATGAAIGLLQDALSHLPLGVNGMAKCIIGYAAASLGSRIDVENTATRAVLTFFFSLLQSVLLYLIERRLLGIHGSPILWVHELIRAVVNLVVAVPLFIFLDRWKQPE